MKPNIEECDNFVILYSWLVLSNQVLKCWMFFMHMYIWRIIFYVRHIWFLRRKLKWADETEMNIFSVVLYFTNILMYIHYFVFCFEFHKRRWSEININHSPLPWTQHLLKVRHIDFPCWSMDLWAVCCMTALCNSHV